MTERYIDENGYLRIDHNPVSKTGVYIYYGQEINLPPRPAPYRVLRSPEVLAAATELFNGASIRIEHKFLGNVEGTVPLDKEPDDGVIINPVFDGETLYTDLIIKTQRGINFINETTAKRALEGKKTAVSMGYSARYALQNGEWNGQTYDAVMVSIESGNHLALLAGDGRIDDAAFIKDNAAENKPDFDFSILTNKGEEMADENTLPPEQNQPPVDDDSMYATKAELAEVKDLLNQILTKIAEAEGKQTTTPPAPAPEVEVKDGEPPMIDSPANPQNIPAAEPEEKQKPVMVEDHAAIATDWLEARENVKPILGVIDFKNYKSVKEIYLDACKKLPGVIAGFNPKEQVIAYLRGLGNQQPIQAYTTQAAKVADGKAKGGIPLTRAEMSATDWSE